ncbi:MAG: DUF2975 domain-containing protein [Turicibacter sp.]
MESKQNEMIRFKKLAHVLSVILTVVFWILVGGLIIILGGLAIINLIPTSQIEMLLTQEPGYLTYTYEGATIALTAQTLKLFSNTMMISGGLIIFVIFYFIKQLRKILKNVIAQTPFSTETVHAMMHLGIGFIFGSFILVNSSNLVDLIIFNSFNIIEQLPTEPSTSFLISFDGASILIGAIIILFAGIFKYGMSLQEEVNATL